MLTKQHLRKLNKKWSGFFLGYGYGFIRNITTSFNGWS